MNIVIAPDSFKESLSAPEVAARIRDGFREVFPEATYHLAPLADGGEGTAAALVAATGGRLEPVQVTGPLGLAVKAHFGITGDGTTAVVEMAAASGLMLVPPALRNPLVTTSRGTGELIRAALGTGARHLIVGIGGSATNDGGAGMLQALGVRLLNAAGDEIESGGAGLAKLERIDLTGLDPRLAGCRIEAACDVDNPLTGARGASAVFGPQKGATPEMVRQLDANLSRFAAVVRRDLKREMETIPGAGAAGGMGAALLAFLGAELKPGIGIVMEAVGLEELIREADLVITGEGCLDSQSLSGKAPVGVTRLARRYGKPVIAIAGSLAPDARLAHQAGIDAVFGSVPRPASLDEVLAEAAGNLQRAARNVAAALRVGATLGGLPGR